MSRSQVPRQGEDRRQVELVLASLNTSGTVGLSVDRGSGHHLAVTVTNVSAILLEMETHGVLR